MFFYSTSLMFFFSSSFLFLFSLNHSFTFKFIFPDTTTFTGMDFSVRWCNIPFSSWLLFSSPFFLLFSISSQNLFPSSKLPHISLAISLFRHPLPSFSKYSIDTSVFVCSYLSLYFPFLILLYWCCFCTSLSFSVSIFTKFTFLFHNWSIPAWLYPFLVGYSRLSWMFFVLVASLAFSSSIPLEYSSTLHLLFFLHIALLSTLLWYWSYLFLFILISYTLECIFPNPNTFLYIFTVFFHILFSPSDRKVLPRTTRLPQSYSRITSSFFWSRLGTLFLQFPVLFSSPHLLFSFFLLYD